MDTLLRHWHMLRLLPRHPRKTSTAELESALDGAGYPTSRRTIQRDLDKLSSAFPLVSDGNKPSGWSWQADAENFDVPGMDTATALTFYMVDSYLKRLLPSGCVQSLQPHIRRANKQLQNLESSGIKDWPQKVRIISRTQQLKPPSVEPEVMEVVYEALFHDRQLLGTYNSRSNKPQTDFVINPLGLIFSDPVIYLAATLWDYPDVRLLALHRLESARLLKDGSRRPADFDLDEYLGAAMEFPSEHSEGTIKLSFLMAADVAHHLRESPLSDNQKISKAENDVVRVSATVNDTRQLRWWLLGFGSNIEVLEPLSLREEFVGMVQEMRQRYQVRAE